MSASLQRPITAARRVAATGNAGVRHFARDFLEMLAAMLVGMAATWLLLVGVLALAGSSYTAAENDLPVLIAAAMGIGMTAPMAAWMRHRGHDWARVAEMAGAMLVLTGGLIVAYAAGAIGGKDMVEAQHAAMIPAMLGVMLVRRGAYSQPFRQRCAPPASPG
jgi:flagellar biosynthetic protein FliP